MYTQDYVDRYNAALDEARQEIASGADVNATLKRLFVPLIIEDINGDAFVRPTLMDLVRRAK